LHHYYKQSTGNRYLIGGSNNWTGYTLQYRTTNDWTALTWTATYASRADAELSAVNYLDKAFIVWYDAIDSEFLAPATVNAVTWTTSSASDADLTNMPSGKFIVRYRDLLYVLYAKVSSTTYPSRAYFCETPVAQALPSPQWTVATSFVEFWQDDWDWITWGVEALDRLVVFKTNSMWTYDETNRRKIADIGCDSYKTIKVINGILYWANRYWIWRWDGGTPQLISGKVQPMIDAIVQTNLWNMVAVYHWYEYRLYIWTVTVDGITYTNAWLVFDSRRETFYVRCTYHTALCAEKYIESWKERIYFGSNTWYVYKQATYIDWVNSDDWNEIDYFFHTNQLDFWAPHQVKQAPAIAFFTKNAWSMKYIIDWSNWWEFPVYRGQIWTNKVSLRDIGVSWYRFIFKFYWKDSNDPFEFEGFVVDLLTKENK
jgi:hypothetical protein